MKKLLVGLLVMFVCVASATTVNLNWLVDGNTYAQTSCETGGNLILPSAPPAKYGYTFRGWTMIDEIIVGTVTQNGTPTPSNPIYPTFYENNGMVLRAVGNVADLYNVATGIITRRIGVRALDGTEPFLIHSPTSTFHWDIGPSGIVESATILCTHYVSATSGDLTIQGGNSWRVQIRDSNFETYADFKQFLADQYANGTPVTIYYPLAEPVEEVWSGQ